MHAPSACSQVATELTEVEAKPKSVAVLTIAGENWKLDSLPLTTVRPFLAAEVVLEEHDDERNLNNEEELRELLAEKIDEARDLTRSQTHARGATRAPKTPHSRAIHCATSTYVRELRSLSDPC
jgi:hypothetical protein